MKLVNCKSCNNWILDQRNASGHFYKIYCKQCHSNNLANYISDSIKSILDEKKQRELH